MCMDFTTAYRLIISEADAALGCVDTSAADKLVRMIINAEKVFLCGVGRSLVSLEAFCKRLNHLGIRTYCVGMLNEPAITPRDLFIAGSGSGSTVFPVQMARLAKRYGAAVAHIGSNPAGEMAAYTDIFVRIPTKTRQNHSDELSTSQIMSSAFEQALYLFCDGLCLMTAAEKKIDIDSLWHLHANLE